MYTVYVYVYVCLCVCRMDGWAASPSQGVEELLPGGVLDHGLADAGLKKEHLELKPALGGGKRLLAVRHIKLFMLNSHYNGRRVLLTGATGFVGKVLLEKLLFALPGIETVFVLLRGKKGLTLEQRFRRELLANPCFDRLRGVHGLRYEEFMLQKVIPIEGDLNAPDLALNPADRATLLSAHIVISVAASVDFNARLDDAIKTNILGVMALLALAQSAPGLVSFTHVSTCYVNSNLPEGPVAERIYSSSRHPEAELSGLLDLPLEDLVRDTPVLTHGFPNTYTYTKNLCERLLESRRGTLSLSIVRPSIISASYREPFVGWLDSVVAVGAIYLTGGLGILNHLHCDPQKVGDLVPVDMVVDYTIVANAANSNSH
jgi:fatty acyl-CoA reductase